MKGMRRFFRLWCLNENLRGLLELMSSKKVSEPGDDSQCAA